MDRMRSLEEEMAERRPTGEQLIKPTWRSAPPNVHHVINKWDSSGCSEGIQILNMLLAFKRIEILRRAIPLVLRKH